jgi:hypothetical protein
MSKQNLINAGQEAVENYLASNGGFTQAAADKFGFSNPGALRNAVASLGWYGLTPPSSRKAGAERPANGERSPRSSKATIKGCIPLKTAVSTAMVLGLDPEESDIGWAEFRKALEIQGEDWLSLLTKRLGGEESEGAKALALWISSNRAADEAAAAAAARAADPTIQLREKLAKANKLLDERERQIDDLREQIKALESSLANARRSSRVNRGGELTKDMLRLMKQRFHPDRNNGSADLCNSIMQWLNAQECE